MYYGCKLENKISQLLGTSTVFKVQRPSTGVRRVSRELDLAEIIGSTSGTRDIGAFCR